MKTSFTHEINGESIQTEYVFPPIPCRNSDWRANLADYEGDDPMGWGRTEQEAINDLFEQLENAL